MLKDPDLEPIKPTLLIPKSVDCTNLSFGHRGCNEFKGIKLSISLSRALA
jgi:hypothetical protein